MPPIPSCITSPLPDSTHVSYPLRFIRHQFRPSRSVTSTPQKPGESSPMPRRASASAVWFTRSEHAFGIFLTRCFLKSPDQSDLSLTALRHLRCLIELSETREKSTVYWIALVTYCCCFVVDVLCAIQPKEDNAAGLVACSLPHTLQSRQQYHLCAVGFWLCFYHDTEIS